MNLSVKTIETHRENIKHKLGLKSGQALVERATKYVEETLAPRSGETVIAIGKTKGTRFPARDGLTTNPFNWVDRLLRRTMLKSTRLRLTFFSIDPRSARTFP